MPLYDFECPHGHRFERMCTVAERLEKVPCSGTVPQLLSDDDVDKAEAGNLKGSYKTGIGPEGEQEVWLKDVPCQLKAVLLVGTHSNPAGLLDHGSASNRDAAREGRYDPLNPNRRFMAKGRQWRK